MRIHICGIYGSGKSTLARKLSQKLNIPYYSLDDIKYIVRYSKIRPVKDRINAVRKICRKKSWITEGTWSDYAEDAFKKADLIILMKVPKRVSSYRILRRHLTRKKADNDTLIGAFKLIRNVYRYYSTDEPVSINSHKKLIEKHKKKLFVIRNNRDIKLLFEEL